MAGIYLHIPFCKRLCAYCDFYKSARLRLLDDTLRAMHRELELRHGELRDRRLRTLYFGGGTPSLCTPRQIGGLIDHACRLFGDAQPEEVTVEANPDDLDFDYLKALREAGVNRLSVGIQSFDDAELKFMNRRHTAGQAVRAVQEAQRAGFDNLTIDLIFGVPGFGGQTLRRNLAQAAALGVQHISAYHLTLEPGTAFGRRAARGELRPVEERTSEEEFLEVHETLTAAGFEHYEVSNFALPGFRARHNAAYWDGTEYLGIGPGAHSYDGATRRWSTDTVESYLDGGLRHEEERLTEHDRVNEWLMTRLRTADGFLFEAFRERFGERRAARLKRDAGPCMQSGALRDDGGRWHIPPERFLISDDIIGTLFESETDARAEDSADGHKV